MRDCEESQFVYKANYGEETNTMCIKKSVFKELLADNPDCQKFYEKRAKERRREFRRLMKTEMRKRNIIKKTMTENEMDEEILRTPQLEGRMPERQRKVLESALSEHDGNDVPDDVLDAISEDEMRFDRKKQVKENN